MIREQEGRFNCTDCGYVYSSMLGDDEIPETCSQCNIKMINPTERKRKNYLAHFEEGVSDAFFLKKMDETKRSSAYYRRGYEFGLKLRLKKGRKPHER